jgi:hypothetical protein
LDVRQVRAVLCDCPSGRPHRVAPTKITALIVVALIAFCVLAPAANAQGPTPPSPNDKILAIVQLVLDTLQGKATVGADALFDQAKQAATNLLGAPNADLFFLDFGNPNLPLNQFAATLARNLLALTPLYAIAYLILLIYDVWKERPIPNPILYAALVAGVMFFLAAFAFITQGMSELGRAIATAVGGTGSAMFARATLLDTIIRILVTLQKNGGILSILALLIAIVEVLVILVQLAYRGISMALWRLIGVLLIPLSVLLEGANPKTAGKVLSGFFEAWLDMVGKITLLLIVLAIASADAFANQIWLVLPAGLLVVVFSWTFLGLFYKLIRDSVARVWSNLSPESAAEPETQLPASAEVARAGEIDAERRKLIDE